MEEAEVVKWVMPTGPWHWNTISHGIQVNLEVAWDGERARSLRLRPANGWTVGRMLVATP